MKFPTNNKKDKVEEQINNITSSDKEFLRIKAAIDEIKEEAYRDAQYTKQRIIAKRERKKQEQEAATVGTENVDANKKEDSFFTINLLSSDNFFDEIELMTKREEDYALRIAESLEEARKKDNE